MWISGLKGLKIMENYKTVRPNIGRGRLRKVLIIWLDFGILDYTGAHLGGGCRRCAPPPPALT